MKNNRCIDAGREGCPCVLAEYGKCLICGRLSGGTCDDCNWQGTCIYTLYQQNGRRIIKGRQERLLDIAEVRAYSENFKVFVLRADRGFCQKAQTAGAYVFVKAETDEFWYGMPVSILKAQPDKGLLHLGVCSCGPKSAHLLSAEGRLCVRGIYYNALSGTGNLRDDVDESFVYGKGIAMAPLRNFLDGGQRYSRYLKNLQLYVDLDKVGFDFFKEYFGDLPVDAVHVRQFAKEGLCSLDMLDHVEETEANVFALTSPYYAAQIQRAAGTGSPVVRPTEGNMCCGEGICGACTYDDELGRTVHRCKDMR